MVKTTKTNSEHKFCDFKSLVNQNTSFSQNSFVEQHYQEYECTQTPRFLSQIDVRSIKENSIFDNNEAINQLLDDFRNIGFDIQEASQHQIQSNKNSSILEQFQLNHNSKTQEIPQPQTRQHQCSSTNKSFFFADSLFLKNVKINCNRLKSDILHFPGQISKFLANTQQIVKEIALNILHEASQHISKSLSKNQQEMEQILRKQQTTEEQNHFLRVQLSQITRQLNSLREQNLQLLKEKKQLQNLQICNQQQAEIIRQLQQKIYQLQYKVKQSKTHCSLISSEFKESSEGLQKKYQKFLEEMKLALTHQIKTQMYYKMKYGYPLQIDSQQEKKMSFTHLKLSKSNSFEEINEVINNLKQINSCLIQRSKFYT